MYLEVPDQAKRCKSDGWVGIPCVAGFLGSRLFAADQMGVGSMVGSMDVAGS